ncbi:MAG: family 16 glycoside hydrolase [Chloroflexota bacterium]
MMDKRLKTLSSGQSLVEYAFLLALVGLVAILSLQLYGVAVWDMLARVTVVFGDAPEEDSDSVLYSEDFNDGLGDWVSVNWGRRSSENWATEGGRLVADRFAGIFLPGEEFDDFRYSVDDVDLTATDDRWQGASLFFRADNGDGEDISGYSFRIQRPSENDPGRIYISEWANGYQVSPWLEEVEAPPDFDWEGSYDIEVVANGSRLEGYIDGELVITAEDDTYNSGSVGLYTHSGSSLTAEGLEVSSLGAN